MCGLAAVQFSPRERSPEEWYIIKKIFTDNLIANEERGREASGVAIINADGGHLMLKAPKSASEFVQTEAYKLLLTQLNSETICLFGHTRKPTKGDPSNYENNHPINSDNIVGIHNGEILNDDELFHKNRLRRKGEVDSEIIFQLMNQIDPVVVNTENYIRAIREQILKFDGKFTYIFIDIRLPSRLMVIKKNQPLSLHWDDNFQALFFSSRYLFLRKTFGPSVMVQKLLYQQGYCFDNKLLTTQKSHPILSFQI